MRKRKKVIVAILLLLLAGVGYGWMLYNKKPADARAQAAFTETDAVQLVKSFQQDEAAANKMYVDKVIVVRGKVAGINIDTDGHATVFLDTGDPLVAVTCSFYDEDVQSVKEIATGTIVRIKGVCNGMLADVILNKCSLVQ